MPKAVKPLTKKQIEQLKPRVDADGRVHPVEKRVGGPAGLVVRVEGSGKKSFFVTCAIDGKRTRRFVTHWDSGMTLERIRRKAGEIRGAVKEGRDPKREAEEARARQGATAPPLRDYLATEYGPDARAHQRDGDATVARIEKCFVGDFGDVPINELDSAKIRGWRTVRLNEGIQKSTLNRDVGALKAALSWGVEHRPRWLSVNPLANLKPLRVAEREPRYLDRETGEHTRLMTALDDREQRLRAARIRANAWRSKREYRLYPAIGDDDFADYLKPVVLVLLHTGIRINELRQLKWGAVDLPRRMLTVAGSTSKTEKKRSVPLNSVAYDALKRWRNQSTGLGLVFAKADGQPIGSMRKAFNGVLVRAGIENFRIHDFRHSFASWLVQDDVSLYKVQKLLGHSSISTTEIYAHLQPDQGIEVVERLTA